jgi:hypothetical protein
VYKDTSLPSSGLNAEQMVDSMDDYKHYHNNSYDDLGAGELDTKDRNLF